MEDHYESAEPCQYGMFKVQHPPTNEIIEAVIAAKQFQALDLPKYKIYQQAVSI